jgi:xanthine dehydrogenase molybdenum-binding subunit
MSNRNQYAVIGKDTYRKDGVAKVTGAEKFASDLSVPGMLHMRVLKSSLPHAKVLKIHTEEAEKLGAYTLTPEEVSDLKFCPRLVSTPEATYKDWRILAKKPLFVGEPIGAVAAETEEEAQLALEALRVDYEPLPAYFDAEEAKKPGAVQLHDVIELKGVVINPERNIACTLDLQEGDTEAAWKECDAVVEHTYRTNRRYHVQLETKSVLVQPDIDGGISLWSTTQSIHNTRLLLHEIFDLPMGKIRIYKVPLGGSFGSSIQVNTIVPIAVAMALKTRKPVKLTMTREEDIRDHVSYNMIFKLKLGAKSDGTLVVGHLDAILDLGSHQIQAYSLLGCMAGWWVSLYRLKAKSYKSVGVYTNKTPSCAFRGYGNPQVTWMVETIMDELAEKIGVDPLDFRLKNYIGEGEIFWGQGPTVKSIIRSSGVEEILQRGAKEVNWYNRPKAGSQTGRFRLGLGMGRGFHTSSAGAPVPGTVVDFSGAIIKLNEDGSVDYITALMDHGGGTLEAHAKIIAEELCIPLENVNVISADTSTTVYDVCTHASRGIYSGGGAALKVAKQVKEKLRIFAARMLDAESSALSFRVDLNRKQGVIYAEGIKGREVTFKEIAYNARHKNWGTIAAVDSYRQPACPPHFTGYFVEVEVDTWTGRVRPIKIVAGADIGTVINPTLAAGQIHGGFAQGWGMALLEDMIYESKTGDLVNRGFLTDYKIPNARDMPSLEEFKVFFVDTYENTGPFGAKGIGEGALNPVAGAVANAIQNALGVRFYELPITRDKILTMLHQKEDYQ